MRWSVVVPGTVSDRLTEAASQAEQAGIYRLWTTESPGRDAVLRSLHLLQATKTLHSGTGIAFAFTRPPLAAAGSAADAYALSGGRFSLGLGAGTRGQRRWFEQDFDHPAARMADYVRAVKAVLRSAGTVRYTGPFYDLSVPRVQLAAPPEALSQLKIYGGGLHEQMLRAIARSCDGIVLHPLAGGVRYLDEVVLPVLEGTTPDDGDRASLIIWCPLSIDEDEAAARRRAAEQLAFYFSTPSYLDVAARSGFGTVAGQLVERYNHSGRPADLRRAVRPHPGRDAPLLRGLRDTGPGRQPAGRAGRGMAAARRAGGGPADQRAVRHLGRPARAPGAAGRDRRVHRRVVTPVRPGSDQRDDRGGSHG